MADRKVTKAMANLNAWQVQIWQPWPQHAHNYNDFDCIKQQLIDFVLGKH